MNIVSVLFALSVSAISATALAGTSYSLPDPAITVTPNWSGTTTIVTVGRVTYSGPSAYYYVSECTKRDSPYYHCNVIREDHVTVTSATGAVAVVTLRVQSASILIRSGHNYWRHADTVLAGALTRP